LRFQPVSRILALMPEPPSAGTPARLDLVRAGFEAIRTRDIDSLLELYTDDASFLPLTGTRVESGGYVGHAGIREYFVEMAEVWEEIDPYADEVREQGDTVVAVGGCHVRGRGSGAEADTPMAWVYRLRDGRISSLHAFATAEEAFAAAGIGDAS
jgi:ketosteroid isomerase-like protein